MDTPFFAASFSNRLELLLDALAPSLLKNRTSPFGKILIVVPSVAMKNWVMHQAALRLGVAFGFVVVLLHEALSILSVDGQPVPKVIELACHIESELKKMESHPFQELSASIALEIAELFLTYGEYAEEEMENWLKTSVFHWQQELWQRTFGRNSDWVPLYRHLKMAKAPSQAPIQVHLFGMSYLSSAHQHFFENMNRHVPVYFWILSPCRMFWNDIKSKKEQVFLTSRLTMEGQPSSQVRELEEYLEEGNALLGNNGRLSRKWQENINELPSYISEIYGIGESAALHPEFKDYLVDGIISQPSCPLSLLQAVQADLALLSERKAPFKLNALDDSIQIHTAPSRLREVEALYETLVKACSGGKLMPKDIIVMAPDFEKYVPFIRMVFGRKDSQLPFEILERTSLADFSYMKVFFQILELANSRWEIDAVFDIFQSPHFTGNHALSFDDLAKIKEILVQEGVRFGLDADHREDYFKKKLIEKSDEGCWKKGLENILKGLIFKLPDEGLLRLSSIKHTQAELLSRFLEMLLKLKKQLMFIHEGSRSLEDWGNFLLSILDTYLENGRDEEEREEAKRLIYLLMKNKTDLSIESVLIYLKKLSRDTVAKIRWKNLQAVCFSPLLPMRAVPAAIVAFLGVNSEVFPRISRKSPLFALKKPVYIPSEADFDRHLFLESLLSARQKWILSAVETDQASPSCLIYELLDYLDASYRILGQLPSQVLVKRHPELSFDPSYFTNPQDKSISQKGYQLALKQQQPFAIKSIDLAPPLEPDAFDLTLLPKHISLRQLSSLFFHPVRYHLNHVHGIYLQEEQSIPPAMEEFTEEKLWDSEWLKWAISHPMEEVVRAADQMGKFPQAPFKEGAKLRFKQNLEEWKKTLQERNVDLKEIFEVEFSYDCKTPTKVSPFKWKLPPKEVHYSGQKILITGTLPYVARQGYLCLRELKTETLMSMLPELLLLQALPKDMLEPKVLFIKKNKEVALKEMSWESCFEHYLRSLHQIIPYVPSWISALMAKDPHQLEKAIQASFGGGFVRKDPYIRWAFQSGNNIDCEKLIQNWAIKADHLFGNILK